jgi:hypothetical protein
VGDHDCIWLPVLAPDGKTAAATGLYDNLVRVWDLPSNRLLNAFEPQSQVQRLSLSPDAKLLVAMLPDAVQLWDLQPGRPPVNINVSGVTTLAFSPDGKTLATGAKDHSIRLWEVATGKERLRLPGTKGCPAALAFSPEGDRLLAADTGAGISFHRTRPVPSACWAGLTARELDHLWEDLADADAAVAFRAMATLRSAAEKAGPYLAARLSPVRVVPERIRKRIAQLDDTRFAVRQRAEEELRELGDAAEAGLLRALETWPSLEVRRRVEIVLEALAHRPISRERLQVMRALEVLETIGNRQARQILRSLAGGLPEARITEEARRAMQRLERRSGEPVLGPQDAESPLK